MKTNEERVRDLLGYLGSLSHVKPEEIPDIDLYMDQVTTFMESHLKDMRRHPAVLPDRPVQQEVYGNAHNQAFDQ